MDNAGIKRTLLASDVKRPENGAILAKSCRTTV